MILHLMLIICVTVNLEYQIICVKITFYATEALELYLFFNVIARWKDLYWVVGYKEFTAKISGKDHLVVFNKVNSGLSYR